MVSFALSRVRFVFLTAALLFFPTPPTPTRAQTPRAVTRPDLRMAFTAPAGWSEFKGPQLPPQAKLAYFGRPANGFAPNVNLVVQKAPGPALPSDAAEQTAAELRRQIPSYRFIGKSTVSVDGIKGFSLTGTLKPDGFPKTIRNRQVIVVRSGQIYTFTFSDLPETYARTAPIFDRFLGSIRWLR